MQPPEVDGLYLANEPVRQGRGTGMQAAAHAGSGAWNVSWKSEQYGARGFSVQSPKIAFKPLTLQANHQIWGDKIEILH